MKSRGLSAQKSLEKSYIHIGSFSLWGTQEISTLKTILPHPWSRLSSRLPVDPKLESAYDECDAAM